MSFTDKRKNNRNRKKLKRRKRDSKRKKGKEMLLNQKLKKNWQL